MNFWRLPVTLLSLMAVANPTSNAGQSKSLTALSRRATGVRSGMTRQQVLNILGPATWAILPGDTGEWAMVDPNTTSLELYWKNGNCAPVQVSFNKAGRVDGIDEGRAVCDDSEYTAVPGRAYSCRRSDRSSKCE
jgi:hypothetical protein